MKLLSLLWLFLVISPSGEPVPIPCGHAISSDDGLLDCHRLDPENPPPPLEWPPPPLPESAPPVVLRGTACYYADFFEGRRTANEEIFRQSAFTAAHRTLRLGTLVEVTSLATGRSVRVRVNDRGPFSGGFVIDLSRAAAREIGVDRALNRMVEIRVITEPSLATTAR